jgi:hypothetical protein
MSGHRRLLAATIVLLAAVGACATGPSTNAPISINLPPTPVLGATGTPGDVTATGGPVAQGGDLCQLLGPADFTGAGIAGATTPLDNFDDAGNHFCTYADSSSAGGGIQFDAFVKNPSAVYQSLASAAGLTPDNAAAQVLSVDKAGFILNGPSGAAIAACKGQFCLGITIPTSPGARSQLIGLARLVLQRADELTH